MTRDQAYRVLELTSELVDLGENCGAGMLRVLCAVAPLAHLALATLIEIESEGGDRDADDD